jgi:hypothetical protein
VHITHQADEWSSNLAGFPNICAESIQNRAQHVVMLHIYQYINTQCVLTEIGMEACVLISQQEVALKQHLSCSLSTYQPMIAFSSLVKIVM